MKNIFKNQSGQISLLGIAGLGVSIALASIGGWLAQNYRTDAKIDVIKVDLGDHAQRTARLEEAIVNLKSDNTDIKKDLKTLIQSNATILQILK